MLAAKKGHKEVVLILTQKGANLDLFNRVSIYVCTTIGCHLYTTSPTIENFKKVVNFL